MATLKIDMCSACSFVIPTMQPAMTAADLFAQWMSSASHNTQASAPFLSTFSQTPQQHYPAGHTLPQSMQPQCTTAAFTQPFAPTPQQQQQHNFWDTPSHSQHKHHLPTLRLHNLHLVTLSTHHITAQPCQVFSHHHTTTQPYPILSSHHHNMDHSSLTSLHHTQQARH